MVDLNQERKAFEGKFPKPHWIEWDEKLGQYTSKHVSDVGYQARFEVWLEAKAQAVPETHLLIPKEPNRKTIMAMACVCLGAVGSGPEFLTLKEAKDVYSALVEKESGAEG
ncbi:hypothetical protein [Acinetobacter baumannii]|uniref:hypothetical protein n=1 Tax=Acinetobacter baumannii TaxID=470 RepID=UPI000DD0C56F|nr:hypothetical protein [Acinetobacter baumannii]MDP7910774.1 hypothetical protein [Acinetobacter baumannii]QUV69006.1 hypothetical protein KPZ59_01250 [Acinetobacter baumannii]HAV5626319.1 hypothetical protein [Acinetobacter baumannii]